MFWEDDLKYIVPSSRILLSIGLNGLNFLLFEISSISTGRVNKNGLTDSNEYTGSFVGLFLSLDLVNNGANKILKKEDKLKANIDGPLRASAVWFMMTSYYYSVYDIVGEKNMLTLISQ